MSRPPAGETPIETQVLDGLALAKSIRAEMGEEIAKLVAGGKRPPCLAVVLVGDDPACKSSTMPSA